MSKLARRIRSNCSYANVTATVAVVLAMSGGAYAAATLPRNSVGSAQIRSGAVGSSEIRNGAVRSRDVRDGTLAVKDLSTAARKSLRGATGPTGPAGAAAVTFRALVGSGGDPAAGNAAGVTHDPGSNAYTVRFSSDVSACVPAATLAKVPATAAEPPAGRITVSASGNSVVVKTFDAAGAPAPIGFSVVVAC
jgi:hypothetical protein